MRLRNILTDKAAINILKFLYDMESRDTPVYSVKMSDVRQRFLDIDNIDYSVDILNNFGLISLDKAEREQIIGISAKGKHFIDIFDKLVQITEAKDEPKKAKKRFRIKYNLTPNEKRIMVVIFKLSKELGNKPVPLQDLIQELYPSNGSSKKAAIARYASKLAELNLLEKEKVNNKIFLKLTPTGERTIKEQLIEALL